MRTKKAANDGGKGTPKSTVDQNDLRFTAGRIAAEHGVGRATVKRAAKFAREVVGKKEGAVRSWVRNLASKNDVIASKNDASSPMHPADYTLDETCEIIATPRPPLPHLTGDRRSAESSHQNDALKQKTSEIVAKEHGVGRATVERAAKFARKVAQARINTNHQESRPDKMSDLQRLIL